MSSEVFVKSNAAQCAYLLSLAEPILTGLKDAHLALEPQPGAKTAGWLVGHLAVTGDFGRHLCGRSFLCPTHWRARFNPGTQPSTEQSEYPVMAELCSAFRAVYYDLCDAALNAEPATLSAANTYAPARSAFPSAGEFVGYLLSPHLAYHLGQLVTWRALAGFGRLPKPDTIAA